MAGLMALDARSQAQTSAAGPAITFDSIEYNFGKVSSGEYVKHIYSVTNTGTEELIISNVHPACGCTTAGTFTRHIAPGSVGSIPIQFNSSRYSGTVVKTIDVYSNAKNQPHATLRLTGAIWKAINVSPQPAYVDVSPDSSSPASTVVHIVNESEQPLVLSNIVTSRRGITTALQEVHPGKEYSLTVTVAPPFEVGSVPCFVTMKTSLHAMPQLSVTVVVNRREAVQVSPNRLMLSAPVAHWVTNNVFIASHDFPNFELSSPICSDNRIRLTLQRLNPHRGFYSLWVSIPPDYQEPSGQAVEITLKTNHPRHPLIRIPVMQSVKVISPLTRSTAVNLNGHP